MSNQAEALKLAGELLADIELSRLGIEQCLLKGNRLARLVVDDEILTWIGYELRGYDNSETAHRYMTETGRWEDGGDRGFFVPLARLQAVLAGEQGELTALRGSTFSGEMILEAQRRHHQRLDRVTTNIATLSAIVSGVRAILYDFATRTYHELLFSEIQAELFTELQSEVDSCLAPTSGAALSKIDVINERLRSGEPEAISHAMTTCRRLIDAVADRLYSPRANSVEVDGQQLSVKQSNVLNRLAAYAYERKASKGRMDRLRRSLHDIYERASKGVHSDVTVNEAKFVFLQTYMLLGELLMLESSESENGNGGVAGT